MGKTSRDERNETNQIDSRQIHTTTTEVDQEYEIDNSVEFDQDNSVEDSNNFTFEDDSEGKLTAGGNITIQSEAISLRAIESSEKAAEEARKASEAAIRAAEKAAEELSDGFSTFSDNVEKISDSAFESNTKVSQSAFDTVEDVTETTVKESLDFVATSFESGLDFLEAAEGDRQASFDSNVSKAFGTLQTSLEDANRLNSESLSNAFQSTVGGLAETQQQTILISVGIVAAVLALVLIFGRKNNG